MASRAEELLQHQVVGVLPLVEKHGRSEANGTDEERQPESKPDTSEYLQAYGYKTIRPAGDKRRLDEWSVEVWLVTLPETRGGRIRRGLPAQALGQEFGKRGSSCTSSWSWGGARVCRMVGAALTDRRTHAKLHQQAKQFGQSPS